MLDKILLAALVALAAYLFLRIVTRGWGRVSGEVARAKVKEGALLLDVRTAAEFATGAIEGAKNVPVQRLGAALGELEKGRAVVVYCASGMRSKRAANQLRQEGFEVLDLGPMSAWGDAPSDETRSG